ncbi:MAG: ribosome small subunit-dependent GTPase A [Oligoflexia bacterium]|nr:ribosome small subunit-dependent GTPase A [Oligoflexia bacterium]
MNDKVNSKIRAQVYRSSQRVFSCKILASENTCENTVVDATAMGLLLKKGDIVVGDYVLLNRENGNNYVIMEREERKNQIFRIDMREGEKRITAANIDLLVIMVAGSKPLYKQGLLDRYLVRAYQWEIPAIVLFNKMDEYDPDDDKELSIEFENDRLAYLNILGFEISAIDLNYTPKYLKRGIAELKEYIRGKSSLFLGASGVGKSKLIEALTNGEVKLKSNKLGRVGKGVHTTTWSEIVEFGEYKFFDSPGIRSFSLEDISKDEIINYFPDLNKYIGECEFANCNHDVNSKGCAIRALLATENIKGSDSNGSGIGAGTGIDIESAREKEIILSRLNSYLHILEEVSVTAAWEKKNRFR